MAKAGSGVPALNEQEQWYKQIHETYPEAHLDCAKTLDQIHEACPVLKENLRTDTPYPVGDTLHEQHFPVDLDVMVMPSARYAPAFIHTHSFFEVICVLSGECENLFSGETLPLTAGDFCIMAPGTTHAIRVFRDDAVVYNLLIRSGTFENSFLGSMPRDRVLHKFFAGALHNPGEESYLCFRGEKSRVLEELVLRMHQEFASRAPFGGFLLNAYLMEFFVELLRDTGREVLLPSPEGGKPDAHLLQIMHAIEESLATITLKDLASSFHYSERHMIRVLKEYTGETFSSLIRSARFDKACELLRNTQLQLPEIMAQVGYSNLTHFYSSFEKRYEMTPAQYRSKHSGENVWQ